MSPHPLPRRIAFLFAVVFASSLSAASPTDTRQAVVLSVREKEFLLGEMRSSLAAIQAILSALTEGDSARAAKVAASRGVVAVHSNPEIPPTLRSKLPASWAPFAQGSQGGFDSVADAIGKNERPFETIGRVAALMNNCIGCHATHRFVDEK